MRDDEVWVRWNLADEGVGGKSCLWLIFESGSWGGRPNGQRIAHSAVATPEIHGSWPKQDLFFMTNSF